MNGREVTRDPAWAAGDIEQMEVQK